MTGFHLVTKLRRRLDGTVLSENFNILIIMDVSCHRHFLPGTSLEPAVIPTAQASSFTLQYFPYYVWCYNYYYYYYYYYYLLWDVTPCILVKEYFCTED